MSPATSYDSNCKNKHFFVAEEQTTGSNDSSCGTNQHNLTIYIESLLHFSGQWCNEYFLIESTTN